MLSYPAYVGISYGSICAMILIGYIILFKLPLRRLAIILESVFHFKEVRSIGDELITIDVCDDPFELSKTVASRIPFIIALGMCLLVIILVFIEGCVFSSRQIFATKLCSDRIPYCYLFRTRFTSFHPMSVYECEPDKPVIPANVTANHAVCYGFILPEQSSIDLLNQLGVCTGILSLVDSLYPVAYRFASRKRGRITLLILLVVILVTEIIILAAELNISFITIVLLTLMDVLIGTILYLQYRKVKDPVHISRTGSYKPLNEIEPDISLQTHVFAHSE
jgi:hypothetical protein